MLLKLIKPLNAPTGALLLTYVLPEPRARSLNDAKS